MPIVSQALMFADSKRYSFGCRSFLELVSGAFSLTIVVMVGLVTVMSIAKGDVISSLEVW